jgi:hypothetical protein
MRLGDEGFVKAEAHGSVTGTKLSNPLRKFCGQFDKSPPVGPTWCDNVIIWYDSIITSDNVIPWCDKVIT